jgi:excisionase family DNA binding protein
MAPSQRAAPTPDHEWLSLGPASRMVGVDPGTLRRWADEGRVPSSTTPGGHRRFDRRDLETVVLSRRHGPRRGPLAALGATPDRLNRAYERSYRGNPRTHGDGRSAVGDRFEGEDRDAMRADGRRLLGALLEYLDATTGPGRTFAEAKAIEAVRATAERMARAGAGLNEAAAAFVAARRPFFAELAGIGKRRSLDVAALAALYDEAVALLDRLLLEFLSSFQSADPHPQGVPR